MTAVNDEALLTSDLPSGTAKIDMFSSTFNWCHQFGKLLGYAVLKCSSPDVYQILIAQ